MKILIFASIVLFSFTSNSAYNKDQLSSELLKLKDGLYQNPELQKALKEGQLDEKENLEQMTLGELEDLQDLEEVYFDKVSTKKSGSLKKRER